MSDELHAAELRFTELSGRRAAIRERLETEWRKPLDELLAGVEESKSTTRRCAPKPSSCASSSRRSVR